MPTNAAFDVIIVGAGIAGLAAATELASAGVPFCILEARERIGGRIFSVHDPSCNLHIPLGAEFIHGKPKEIWEPLRKAGIQIDEVGGEDWCVTRKQLSRCEFFSQVKSILDKMDDSLPDESFDDFLARYPAQSASERKAQQRTRQYVSGFNAAETSKVGVHWLVQQMREEERIDGDRAFRPHNGYAQLVDLFLEKLPPHARSVRTSTPVRKISWKPGYAEVELNGTSSSSRLRASCALITIPLGVLKASADQAGALEFDPPLSLQKQDALSRLEMGKVIRVTLRFREKFWEEVRESSGSNKSLSKLGFLFTEDELFPTWWTMAEKAPIITGWAPVHSAERLSGREPALVVQSCLQSLSKSLQVSIPRLQALLEASYFHDWQTDHFSQGAYSYGKVGSAGAAETLAEPVENTLFFAGEHTDASGNSGTVHGAIASGYRAAKEIIAAKGRTYPG